MDITGLQYADGKITSYMFTLNNKRILFDFGTTELSDDVVSDLDCIFISHYHHDHVCGLLDKILNISSKCKLFMTRTTKEVLEYIIQRQTIKDSIKERMLKKLSEIFNIALFNKEYDIDGLKFKFYRSGHCFGGVMLSIKDSENSLFFSSDMDYVSSDSNRQYEVDEYIDVDFAILDGTVINDEDFKKSKLTSIKYNEVNDMRLYCKLEKAVPIAKFLSDKHRDSFIVYDADLEPLITIFYRNGYDCFNKNYNIFPHSLVDQLSDVFKDKNKVYLSSVNKANTKFFPDKLFSLHIGNADRKDFIEKCFKGKTKILLGHYDINSSIEQYCKQNNYGFIKKGSNSYGKD